MLTTDTELVPQPFYSLPRYDFFLVGIGYSNGGLDPLKTIISTLPTDISAAVLVISNGPLNAPDKMITLLQEVTLLPVIKVDKQIQLHPGHIYVLPPDQLVSIRDHILSIEPDRRLRRSSRVIDACFRSLAYEGREKTICVILSGLGYDGLEGAIAVEGHGGLVIAQDPATAKYPMMPISVIANDDPSFILSPEEIGELIISQLGR
jgi:two-component system CheB/CheR fusion protein